MSLQVYGRRYIWLFTGGITGLTILATLTGLAILYLIGGKAAFHLQNAIVMSILMPFCIAAPTTYYIACTSVKLRHSRAELKRLANTDHLTQLPNRRAFFKNANSTLANTSDISSLLVIDADHFKDLNDNYGHMVGDRVLTSIADILKSNFRENDLVCRVGGEEFAVLIPGMDAPTAKDLAKRVVQKINASPLFEDNAIIEFSVSCGVADTQTNKDLQSLFKAADDAMYLAKEQGRNRVVSLLDAA